MKTIQLTVLAIICIGFTSCNNDDDTPQLIAVKAEQFVNLHAPQTSDFTTSPPTITGDFVKFDFATGTTTTSDTDWDIAFRGTTILVNGGASSGIPEEPTRTGNAGAYILTDIFNDVNTITESSFEQDSALGLAIKTGSGNGWYNYDGSNPFAPKIEPIPGKVIVFRTADNKYAKVEILSYYKDNPDVITEDIAQNDSRYFTFNYVYQPNEGKTTFE